MRSRMLGSWSGCMQSRCPSPLMLSVTAAMRWWNVYCNLLWRETIVTFPSSTFFPSRHIRTTIGRLSVNFSMGLAIEVHLNNKFTSNGVLVVVMMLPLVSSLPSQMRHCFKCSWDGSYSNGIQWTGFPRPKAWCKDASRDKRMARQCSNKGCIGDLSVKLRTTTSKSWLRTTKSTMGTWANFVPLDGERLTMILLLIGDSPPHTVSRCPTPCRCPIRLNCT